MTVHDTSNATPHLQTRGFAAWFRGCLPGVMSGDHPAKINAQRQNRDSTLKEYPATRLELSSSPQHSIKIRYHVSHFDDARFVVHGLRDGQTQIVNLADATEDVSERILNFLTGAAEALDAEVEHLGVAIYLLTPISTAVVYDVAPNTSASAEFLKLHASASAAGRSLP